MNAVKSDEKSFDKSKEYINSAKINPITEDARRWIVNKSKGYFKIEPTVTWDPKIRCNWVCERIFGRGDDYVVSRNHFEEALELVDQTSPYDLTGAIFLSGSIAVEMLRKS